MSEHLQETQDRMITFRDVSRITAYKSKNTLKTKEDLGEFPRRIYLSSNCIRWWESEVLAWAKQQTRTLPDAWRRRNPTNQAVA